MFPQPLAQWAGPVTGIAAALLVLFTGYVLAGSKRSQSSLPVSKRAGPNARKKWGSSVPHTGPLPSDLEYQVELTWK